MVFLRLMSYVKRYPFTLVVSLFCAVLGVVVTLLIPVLTGQALDAISGMGDVDFESVTARVLNIVELVIAAFVAQWMLAVQSARLAYNITRNVRDDIYLSLENFSMKRFDRMKTGELVSLMVADVEQICDGLLLGFTKLFTGLATIAGTIVFMVGIDLRIAFVVILVTPLSLFAAAFIARRSHRFFGEQSALRGEQTAFVNEMISGQKTVRAYAAERKMLDEFERTNGELELAGKRAMFYSSLVNPVTRFVNSIVYLLVGFIGALFAINGAISVGSLYSLLAYANQYTKPFNEISGVISELQNALACAKRVFAVFDADGGDTQRNEDALCDSAKTAINEAAEHKAQCLRESAFDISFEHVGFSYDGEHRVLDDITFCIESGKRVAVVGETGGGKTTLINLLMGFYEPDEGGIFVLPRPEEKNMDGGSESPEASPYKKMNINSIDKRLFRNRFAMVLQDTWIKKGTVAENIAFGKPDASRDEVIAAAAAVYADGFINQLENGYDTVLSEASDELSEGQKQLLMLARAMLKAPDVLILDEATSSVDTLTEMRINKAFDRLMEGRTSFVVAHRLSTVRDADLILVVSGGRIAERGTHEELIRAGGIYSNMMTVNSGT